MDPTACVALIINHLSWFHAESLEDTPDTVNMDFHRRAAIDSLGHLRRWLRNGGGPPDMRGFRIVP